MNYRRHGKVLQNNERDADKVINKEVKRDGRQNTNSEKQKLAFMPTGSFVNTIPQSKTEDQKADKAKNEETKQRTRLNCRQLRAYRNIIEDIYEDMEVPTVRKIISIAKKQLNFNGSRARMRSILRNQLGFKFNKRHPNKNLVFERNSILLFRYQYLKAIRENDALGENKKTVVYVGECVLKLPKDCKEIHASGKEINQKARNEKLMITLACTKNSFIDGAESVTHFKFKKPTAEDFVKYLEVSLLPKLPKESIVVMSYSPRHNMSCYPTIFSTKAEIQKWMTDHQILFEQDWLKTQLLDSIKTKYPDKKFVVDELLAKHGHKVLRIPPFHTDLNPVDYTWMKIKSAIGKEKNKDEINDSIMQGIRSITAEDWKEYVDCVKKIEDRYWLRDCIKEDDYENLYESVGMLLSDSDSDSDTDYDNGWSSSSSEESDEDSLNSEDDWTDIEVVDTEDDTI